jgi:hypothetical protein
MIYLGQLALGLGIGLGALLFLCAFLPGFTYEKQTKLPFGGRQLPPSVSSTISALG